nr:unnamed protein product [Digitaria exilis]
MLENVLWDRWRHVFERYRTRSRTAALPSPAAGASFSRPAAAHGRRRGATQRLVWDARCGAFGEVADD